MMIRYALDPAEIEWTAVRAQGAGGQNGNKNAPNQVTYRLNTVS